MAQRVLQREGWSVNHTRVHRLWQEDGLLHPTTRRKKRAKPSDGSLYRHPIEHLHQVWEMVFQFDAHLRWAAA